ncbi:MAG: 5'/3'-nucleotidase SurE [Acidimicrobiia bacterium]
MAEPDRAAPVVVAEAKEVEPTSVPRVLLTNDDGIESPGLRLLAERLHGSYELVVAAPVRDMSGSGTGIGRFDNSKGIELRRASWNGIVAYTVDGPPGLAVMAAALGAFGPKPALVVSGVNAGVNTGHSVIHSGTVGAVLTARTFGSHGLAVSLAYSDPWQWESAVASATKAASWILGHRGRPMVLNVNVPGLPVSEILGTRWADLDEFGYFRVAMADHVEQLLQFEISNRPTGGQVEVGGSEAGRNPSTDTALCHAGYVTMTALTAVEPAGRPEVPPDAVIPMPAGGATLRSV